jgi:DNA-binding MarR family transcriptional regulator
VAHAQGLAHERAGSRFTGAATATRIVNALARIVRLLDIHSRRLAAEAGVTSPQLRCLRRIVRAEGVTATLVAHAMHLSSSTVVGIVDRLEEKGLVDRARDTKDRRVGHLLATEHGRDLVGTIRHPIQSLLTDRIPVMLSRNDHLRIADSLEILADALSADGPEALLADTESDVPSGERARLGSDDDSAATELESV